MPKRVSAANQTPVRVVVITLDTHLSNATDRARQRLTKQLPGLTLTLHAAAEWGNNPTALQHCIEDIEQGDIIFVSMLFMEDHINAVLPALKARREACDALVACMSATEVVKLTTMGSLVMDGPQTGAIGFLKRLHKSKKKDSNSSDGSRQMAMLRRLPRILKYIPGKAQDLRAYFLTLQYWLACSDENMFNLVNFLIGRYAAGPRAVLKDVIDADPPADYPEVGLYSPRLKKRVTTDLKDLPAAPKKCKGTVGLLLMRSYVLAGDTKHYDGVIAAIEARGLRVVPAFAFGLDSRPAIQQYFLKDGVATVDSVVSLTGFSLVGGPAYNDAKAAEDILAELDVPYLAGHAVEFQTREEWRASERGLMPIESTMMVAIPELDGAAGPMVFGGRTSAGSGTPTMQPDEERAAMLAARLEKLVALRRSERQEKKVAIVLFNFPPHAGAVGTAAHLSVFRSLFNTLSAMKAAGYDVEVPDNVEALQDVLLGGNSDTYGTVANVHDRIATDDYVRSEPYLDEIEAQWGPSPGKHLSDGAGLFVLGAQFGNIFVGLQPSPGYEGDPMRLLFEKGFAPTQAFSAFYRYIREDFGAAAVLHFGTHGALEFMPGKQVGLSDDCWPDRLIGDLPNLYLSAANNPSEGTIAKRHSAATLVSYLTPPAAEAGLYKGLIDLKDGIDRWRNLAPDAADERARLEDVIQAQAAALDIEMPVVRGGTGMDVNRLWHEVREFEETLIPHGLHVVGEEPSREARIDFLSAIAGTALETELPREALAALVDGEDRKTVLSHCEVSDIADPDSLLDRLVETHGHLTEDTELPAIIDALDGRFIRPTPGGDLIRAPEVLPTGRNVHGFDPYRMPSAFAEKDGGMQAERLLKRLAEDGQENPETIAMVLWGTDNLKNQGGPIGQTLALMGAKARFDSFGRLAGAELIPLEDLGRPRIDVVVTLSGIFRDLLPLQTKLLAEAAYLAATADEPEDKNYIRKHALAYAEAEGVDMETASLRVFSNADGAYGANVGNLIESGAWSDEDELAETFVKRKSFAYCRNGTPVAQESMLRSILADTDLAYQNLDSVEIGVTTIDHYFDTLGGISRTVAGTKGEAVPVYIGDQTTGEGKVRSLEEQVSLETRTRMLNPKWYDALLEHGYEGVRQIESHVTNTLGWSATTGQVDSWVYKQLTETFMLDDELRSRMTELNPAASAKLANRLIEAHERNYWTPDEETLDALRRAGEELEDRLEGIGVEEVAA